MATIKEFFKLCAVEMLVVGGFFIVGILCLCAGAYDGAVVSGIASAIAGVLAYVRWRKLSYVGKTFTLGYRGMGSDVVTVTKPQPVKPRRVIKAKKKPTAKRPAAKRK